MCYSLMIEAEEVSETLKYGSILTRIARREIFIAFSSREKFKSFESVLGLISTICSIFPADFKLRYLTLLYIMLL